MKVSKKSLIASIAVLCVCAMSLTAASFAWFTTTTQANVNKLNLGVVEQSDLKIAVDPAVEEEGYAKNIESNMWGVSFTGADIAEKQDYNENTNLANATWDADKGYFVTVSENDADSVDSVTGFYDGTLVAASAGTDYVEFTVYFRSTKANQEIVFNGIDFSISSAKKALLNGLTLRVNDEEYNNSGMKNVVKSLDENGAAVVEPKAIKKISDGGTVCVIGENEIAGKGFYTAAATFQIFVEGQDQVTINQNAGIKFVLENLSFKYAPEAQG